MIISHILVSSFAVFVIICCFPDTDKDKQSNKGLIYFLKGIVK
ncbi:hypothetical protein QY95_01807 [Bacillus thermotolerans]|uniref:Uncharacterized protein n=1 Tax=Bacillus thermotolerans TaxID=1221996 RepID=A0A0F5I3C9_BACTR|nr:hypothetical protein QY95_01807 [Bacillus thermotolerans]